MKYHVLVHEASIDHAIWFSGAQGEMIIERNHGKRNGALYRFGLEADYLGFLNHMQEVAA